jgi:cytosine/uracil/thiamine/allantoin permease
MKSEWRLFGLVAAFLFACCVVYAFWTRASLGSVDWIGSTALVLSGLLCAMCAMYFFIVSRRIDPRPEDRPEAEISDGAGEVGFFSPGSYWPFGIALAALVAGIGMVYWQVWLLAVGLIGILVACGGLLFEYYTGARRAAE